MKFFRTLGPILGVAVLALIASYAVPQTSVNGGRTFLGPVDNSGATRTAPVKVTTSSPGTCTVGDFIFRSDATAGQNLFFCTATNTFTQQLNSGSSSGGGVSVYSANGLTVTANTYYFPIGGGGSPSTTETNVDVDSPAAATITNFYAQLSVALGAGNSGVFTMRKNASSQSVTCTISGASATNCSDTTHSFAVSQGDLLTVQLVTSGTIVVTPNVMFAFQFGNITATGTVNTGTINQIAYYAAGGTALSGETSIPTAAIPAGTPVLIQTQTASGTPSSITFSSISGGYTNLKLVITARGDTASQTAGVGAQLNTDTGANYTQDFFSESNAACCNPGQSNGQTSWFFGNMSAASSLANAPGIIVVTIPSYSGTQFLKAFTSNWLDLNGSAITSPRQVGVHGGIWNSTAAITSIKLITSAGNFVNGSVFSLYGE